jgi:hypothetical protein
MLRNRFLILLGACFLTASAACADEVGYLDCSSHSDGTQVFGKPRKSQEVVASIPCGERFTILVYGFYFSRIQTKDGQIGYIYSNLIAVDRGATASQQTPSMQVAAEKTKIPSTRNADVKSGSPAPVQSQPAPIPQAVEPSSAQSSSPVLSSSTAAPAANTSVSVSPAVAPSVPEAPAAVAQPDLPAAQPAPAQPQPTPAEPEATQPIATTAPDAAAPVATSNPPETPAPVAQPDPTVTAAQPAAQPAQPEPAPAKPAPAAIRPVDTHDTWERPLPSVRRYPLLELFGGFAFATMNATGGGSATNFNGGLGSFGYNLKPWLQIVGDTSYSFVTVSGTKNVLYGNHYGPRYYYRALNRLHLTPFAEGLVGGSRSDTTISGAGGYSTSQNCISFKVGGGVDYRPSRRWEIRLFDVDYYRTAFGTNAHQNNYWVSTGVVLRLFGGRTE